MSTTLRIRQTIGQPIFAAFLAGGLAGAVSRTIVSPLERLKILFQIQSVGREEYKLSVGKGLMKMWREEGFKGLMRGNGTNCIRIVPYSAVQFGSYNFYKRVRVSPSRVSSRVVVFCWMLVSQADRHSLTVCRDLSRRNDTGPTSPVRWGSRDHISRVYISVGHCSHPIIHPVGFLCRTRRRGPKTAPRHVGNHEADVPE